ncbi:MGAT4B isoform 18, partial [Pan troglodytes]
TSAVTENIKALFPTEIHSGLLEVISPSPHFYPDFSRLRESFGDPKERVRWRTKQNLDYCFLMMYAQSKGIYYVQLEDDIVAKPNYLSTMKNFALQQPSEDWMILEFSQLGFIARGHSLLAGWQDPETEGQRLWKAGAAEGAREPASRAEHEPEDIPALHPGESLPARGLLLGLHPCRGGLHPLPLLPASKTGAVLLPQWEHRAPGGQALQHVRGGAALRQPSVRQGGPAGGPHRHPPVPSEPRRLPPDRLLLQGSGRGRGGPSLRPSGSTAPLDPDGLPCVGDSERDLPEKGRLSCGLLRVPCGQP